MYLEYVRTYLSADERLTEKQRDRLAQRIIRWAEDNDVRDISRLHDKLVDWIDQPSIQEEKFENVEHPLDNDGDVNLLEDPKSQTPVDLFVIGEREILTGDQLRGMILEESPELSGIASVILPESRVVGDNVDLDGIENRLRGIVPRIKCGKLLIPQKQVLCIRFDESGNLQIAYKRGYQDDRVNEALRLYSELLTVQEIGPRIGVSPSTVCTWLYKDMGLMPARDLKVARQIQTAVKLFDEGKEVQEIMDIMKSTQTTVWRWLNRAGVEFNSRGPEPWVYETKVRLSLSDLDEIYSQINPTFRQRNNYREIFKYIKNFEKENKRGPSRDEISDALGVDPWKTLQVFVEYGILEKRRLPRRFYV